mmetsp:Transcript_59634/g.121182  ORF Transcript_59634/g.121182 Transcript_59634/m.121182 type:complete len:101 (+) Transcript_59634:58-360(+)
MGHWAIQTGSEQRGLQSTCSVPTQPAVQSRSGKGHRRTLYNLPAGFVVKLYRLALWRSSSGGSFGRREVLYLPNKNICFNGLLINPFEKRTEFFVDSAGR